MIVDSHQHFWNPDEVYYSWAAQRGFTAVETGVTVSGSVESVVRQVETANVVGLLPGLDPRGGNPWLDVAVPTGLGHARNALVARCEAVVAIGGAVGLDVQLSALGAGSLPAAGSPVRLWTHLAVREDHWSLYGFVDDEERAMFRLLISVSGVGPKVALGMLSGARATDIALFLRSGDEKALAKLPGIGKKSAARLVVELGNRVPEVPGTGPASVEPERDMGPLGDALAVLLRRRAFEPIFYPQPETFLAVAGDFES